MPNAAPIPDTEQCTTIFGAMQEVTTGQRKAAVEGKIVGTTINLAVNPSQEAQQLALPNGSLTGEFALFARSMFSIRQG